MDQSPESSSESIAVQHAKDLERPARDWLQQIFGRPLRDDEDITIVLSAPHPAPDAALRQVGAQRLQRVLDKAAANMQAVPDAEFQEAIDEAIKHIRPSYEP